MSQEKIKIGFLVKSTNGSLTTWECFSQLYLDLQQDARFDCRVYICPDLNWSSFDVESSTRNSEVCIAESGIPFVVLKDKDLRIHVLKNEKLDYVFITSNSPSYAEYSPGILFRDLRQLTKLCYIPYGAVTISDDPYENGKSWHAQAPNHMNSFFIFADAEPLSSILKSNGYCHEAIKNIGHIKLDNMCKLYDEKKKAESNFKMTVLIGQHHSMESSWISNWQFGTFNQNNTQIINIVKDNPNIKFIFRPHPLLPYAFDELNSKGSFESWLEKYLKYRNAFYNPSGSTTDLFHECDILITDGISYLTEFPIVANKPVIFLENKNHVLTCSP